MRSLPFGKYIPSTSFVHKVDPRVKILFSVIICLFAFGVKNLFSLIFLGFGIIGIVIFSGIPIFKFFSSLKSIIIVVVFSSVINLIFEFFNIHTFSKQFFLDGVVSFLKFLVLILSGTIIMFTTSPVDISYALENLLFPFKYFKVNVEEIAVTVTISLRLIPMIFEEFNNLILVQKSRGICFDNKSIFQKIKIIFSSFVLFLYLFFKKANNLVESMESRCYNNNIPRTKYKILRLSIKDAVATIYIFVIILGAVLCNQLTK